MKKTLLSLLTTFPFLFFCQVAISTPSNTIDATSALEIGNNTNKGLLIPRLAFTTTDLKSTAIPIVNPAEGLMFYNTDSSNQLPGLYIRSNNMWNLFSTSDNKTTDFMMYTPSTNSVTITPTATYADFPIISFKNNVLINTTTATYTAGNNLINLQKGTYVLMLTLNINTDETAGTGLNGKDIHAHSYKMKVVNSAGVDITNASEFQTTVVSNSATKTHLLIAKINFDLTAATDVKLQIARNTSNTTYNGAIRYTAASFHLLKAIKK